MVRTSANHLFFLTFGLSLLLTVSPLATAQSSSTRKIQLKDAVIAALAKNTTLKISGAESQVASSNFRQTNAVFLPSVELGYTAMTTNNPLNVFGFKLQQQRVAASDFMPDLLNHPGHTQDYSAKVEVQQPLLNLDMLYQRNAAAKQKELYEYKYQRTREFVEFDTRKAYLNLQLAYRSVAVLEESLRNMREIAASTQRFFDQGLLKKSDVLNAQVQVATVESQLAKANSMVLNASEALAVTMGANIATVYQPDSLLLEEATDATASRQVSSTRADLMAMQKAVDATSMMVRSEQMSLLPRINAFGSFQYNDSQLGQFDVNSYLVGVKLSWTLFNGTKNYNAIRARKAERTKMELELMQQQDQSQLELDKAQRDRLDLLAEINRQNVSVAQAEESLRILQDRYREGLVSTTDLLTAQTQLLQQKMALAQAVYGNNLTLAYLQFLTAK
ncbi:TolC family protein [Paludibacter jiangxiensis]|uniref:Outer membrane protein TolC n=1 Tax=Paludibacter jiangxiensis TaxID=681398 RepID=A0A161LEH8_9BACT|nr:TolC family protein [Paludibacter jiangxiensis]GAT62687.1 outer membrane protein TolC [Paludibacter jiangxiensis]